MKIDLLKKALLSAMLLFGTSSAAFAGTGDIALGVKGGTAGIGGEVTVGLIPAINIRSGYNAFNYSGNASKSDINYDYKLKLKSIPVLLDWHPFANSGFRLSSGIFFNNNEITATGKSQTSYKIGDTTYYPAELGTLTGKIDFNKTSPYAGIGWGNAVGNHGPISLSCDIGVIFQGTPKVSLAANGSIASNTLFQDNLNKEISKIKDTTDDIKYYPVISLGLAYRF
jgi:hypothetical protein